MEVFGQGGAGGQDFAEGFGNAPADVARFLIEVPHEAADDIARGFGLADGQAGGDLPQGHGGAVHGLRAQEQEGKQRPHIFHAALADGVQMVAPVRAGEAFFEF